MSQIIECRCTTNWIFSDLDNLKIDKDTTPEEFDVRYEKCRVWFQKYQGDRHGERDMPELDKAMDSNRETMIHSAVRWGNIEVMRRILGRKGNKILTLGTWYGGTALHTAVAYQQYEAAQSLLKWGAPVNMKALCNVLTTPISFAKLTPLWYAAQITRDIGMCIIFLGHGGVASPEVDREGEEILKEAQQEIELRPLILKNCISMLTLYTPMAEQTMKIVKGYLDWGSKEAFCRAS